MIAPRRTALAISACATLLCGCRPYGCDTDRCVEQATYNRSKQCYVAYQAGVQVRGDPRSRTHIRGDASVLQSQALRDLDLALKRGHKLGLDREAIYRDLERERLAYLRPFASGTATSAQYDMLVENISRCEDGEDL